MSKIQTFQTIDPIERKEHSQGEKTMYYTSCHKCRQYLKITSYVLTILTLNLAKKKINIKH